MGFLRHFVPRNDGERDSPAPAVLAMTEGVRVIANEVKQSQCYERRDCFVAGAPRIEG